MAGDGNDGSAAKPFKSIGAAMLHVAAGDTLSIRAGVYRESAVLKAVGSVDKPIIITAAPGERVVIDGADIIKGWTPIAPDARKLPLWVKSGWATTAKVSGDLKTRGRGPQVSVDSIIYRQVETQDDMFPGTFLADTNKRLITLWPLPPRSTALTADDQARFWDAPVNLSSSDPNEHLVEVGARPVGLEARNASYTTIRGITVRHGVNAAQEGAFDVLGNHNLIEDCTVEYTHGRGFSITGQFDTVKRCNFSFNGSCGAGAQMSDSVFADNTLSHNSTLGIGEGWENGGIKFSRTVNLLVQGNRFISNEGPGLWFDFCDSNIIIERNLSIDNAGANIMMEITPNYMSNAIDAKPLLNTRRTEQLATPWSANGINIIRNNICVGARGVAASGILLQLASNTRVLNNTVVGNGGVGVFVRYHPYNTEGNRCWDNLIENNLLVNNKTFGVFITPEPSDKPGFVARNVSDNNLLFDESSWSGFGGDAPKYARWGKTEFGGMYSQEELGKIFGYDQHSIQADPMFVAPAVCDYRLQPGSAAIGSALAVADVTNDFYGHARPKHPSMGAIEFTADTQLQTESVSASR